MTKPTPARPEIPCPQCGEPFTPTSHRQSYCTPKCQRAYHILDGIRGQVLLQLAQVARAGRNGYKPIHRYALSQQNALLDEFAREDRAAGRRPDLLVARKMAAMWCAADLLDRKKIS